MKTDHMKNPVLYLRVPVSPCLPIPCPRVPVSPCLPIPVPASPRSPVIVARWLCVLLLLFTATSASAHDPGLSAADLHINNSRLEGELSFALGDIEAVSPIDANHDQKISVEEFAAARARLEQIGRGALMIALDGQPLECQAATAILDMDSNAVRFRLEYRWLSGSLLELDSVLIKSLARGHRQILVLRDEQGRVRGEQMLQASDSRFQLNLSQQNAGGLGTFTKFVVLGIEHILTGYDHLAFLFALLLAGSTLKEVLKIIRSFTAAHSISLALATFNVVSLPPSIVEPLIAVSIVYIGCENLLRRNLERRWLLTFGFGLIHGLGFATVLRELNVGSEVQSAVIPLLSFNLGVEFGQIAIAAVVLPLIWKLKPRPWFVPRLVPACSTCVALLGAFWLVARLLPQ